MGRQETTSRVAIGFHATGVKSSDSSRNWGGGKWSDMKRQARRGEAESRRNPRAAERFRLEHEWGPVTHFSHSIDGGSDVSYVNASKPGEHGDDHNGNGASRIPGYSSRASRQARVSGRAGGGGRDRRVGKKHAAVSAEALAGNRRGPDPLHGKEFFSAGEIGDAARETAPAADAHDLFVAARRRFCGSL